MVDNLSRRFTVCHPRVGELGTGAGEEGSVSRGMAGFAHVSVLPRAPIKGLLSASFERARVRVSPLKSVSVITGEEACRGGASSCPTRGALVGEKEEEAELIPISARALVLLVHCLLCKLTTVGVSDFLLWMM